MFITENLIDVHVSSTVETYGDVYPDNAKYMEAVQQMTDEGLIISREVTEISDTLFLVKTTFANLESYTTYLKHPEVSNMGAWLIQQNSLVTGNKYEME